MNKFSKLFIVALLLSNANLYSMEFISKLFSFEQRELDRDQPIIKQVSQDGKMTEYSGMIKNPPKAITCRTYTVKGLDSGGIPTEFEAFDSSMNLYESESKSLYYQMAYFYEINKKAEE